MKRLRQGMIFAGLGLLLAAAHAQHAPAGASPAKSGADAYAAHCAICHGEQREGILPAFPPLVGVKRQLSDPQIIALIARGKGRMPAFPKLQNDELASLLAFLDTPAILPVATDMSSTHSSDLAQGGRALFQQNCAFCHGRDTMGGETGPDLTRSKLVLADVNGDRIAEVTRNGRPEKKMPAFNFSSQELLGLAAFIHEQVARAATLKGGRRGVDAADLQTGNAEAGKQYFNGAGTCSTCHSAAGDLAGVAHRYEGLDLERRMLYPQQAQYARTTVTVTLSPGQTVKGVLGYQDEFVIGLWQADGTYRSWPKKKLHYAIDAPVHAHADLLSRYTDDDVHNLMAYIQTLR